MFGKKFKKYFVVGGPYQIHAGQHVEISKEQARKRKFVSKHIKDDIYECLSPFQFKAGEIFGFDGDIDKRFAKVIIDPDAKKDSSLNEKLKLMSPGQLKYYARVNCNKMKFEKDQPESEMIEKILSFSEDKKEV